MATKKIKTKTVVKKAKKVAKVDAVVAAEPVVIAATNYSNVLSRPRITEKASYMMQMNNAFTFNVAPGSNKKEVEKAIFSLYKVKPIRVSMVNTPKKSKRNMRTGKYGEKGGGRKAYVYLKKGDTINSF